MRARIIGSTLAVCLATGGALALGAEDARACDLWASQRGNDANAGSAGRPYRTVGKLVSRLEAGQMGCLVAGSTFVERVVIRTPRITLMSADAGMSEHDDHPVIRGGIRIDRGADRIAVSELMVRGQGDEGGATLVVRADGVKVLRSEIDGLGTSNQNEPCILLDGADGTVIDGNVIRQCTRATRHDLYSAGIVAVGATRTTIRNNIIHHIVGDAVALRSSHGSSLNHNLITSNVSGVFLAGNASANRIFDNIIANSGQHNVRSTVPSPVGLTNIVRNNCLWHGYAGDLDGAGSGFTAQGNRMTSPRLAGRHHDLRPLPGPCYAKRPYGYVKKARARVMPTFSVRYRLIGLPRSVKVVQLELMHVEHHATVSVRCARGCRASRLADLRGRWLARGTVIEVRARRHGWVGHYARITILGAPEGLRIDHACMPPGRTAPVPCRRYR